MYAVALFFLSTWLVKRNLKDGAGSSKGNTVLSNLLYLLFIVAIGVSGTFIPVNLISCGGNSIPWEYNNPGGSNQAYSTDFSLLPSDVSTWYNQGVFASDSFAYLPTAQVTYFEGRSDSDTTVMWELGPNSTNGPTLVEGCEYPDATTAVISSDSTQEVVCFLCTVPEGWNNLLVCIDGSSSAKRTLSLTDMYADPTLLVSSDGRLYLKALDSGNKNTMGTAVYSVDPFGSLSDSLVNHSTVVASSQKGQAYTPPSKNGSTDTSDTCDEVAKRRQMSWALLGLAVLPSLAATIALFWKRKIPSMVIALYICLYALLITLIFGINPQFDKLGEFVRWYAFVSSLLWLLISTVLHLTNRVHFNTLSWSLNFSATIFFVSSFFVFIARGDNYDSVLAWVGITFFSFLPLLTISLVTSRSWLLVLGAIGILFDVWRLTGAITESVSQGAKLPIQFVVLAVCGVGLGFLGRFINKREDAIQARLGGCAQSCLGRWRVKEDADDDTMNKPSVQSNADDAHEAEMAVTIA